MVWRPALLRRVQRCWQRVDVRRVRYEGGAGTERRLPSGRLLLGQMVTDLAVDGARTAMVGALVRELAAAGRHVLVLTERVDHVAALADSVTGGGGPECGRLHGSVGDAERAQHAQRRVVVATYPLCRQGFDVPRLDTLVMATPVTSIEQPIGRILRVHPDKADPLVIDVVDPYSIFAGEARKRLGFYAANGYNVADDS